MIKYFKDILITFSKAQRIWALIILCLTVSLITFGSNIIDLFKTDNTQQTLIIDRQKKQILFLNKQLDNSTLTIDSLTNKVLDGQNECSKKRFKTQQEMNKEIDSLIGLITPKKHIKYYSPKMPLPQQDSSVASNKYVKSTIKVNEYDNVIKLISGLKHLKNKLNK